MIEVSVPQSDSWPSVDIENLGKCPVCASADRSLQYSDLEDWSFRVAPGKWVLWSCKSCCSLYLDPRPSVNSIGRAYGEYYTHGNEEGDGEFLDKENARSRSLRSKCRSRVRASYIAIRFDSIISKYIKKFGASHPRLIPARLRTIDLAIRHLPFAIVPNEKLLDIGCGNGDFLREAQKRGYDAVGVEPDPLAIESARRRGLNVVGGNLPHLEFSDNTFGQVTVSHVIEHLHSPEVALREIRRVLRPNGRVWISTPNTSSKTLEHYGKYWRGLETPRHLVLFDRNSIARLLRSAGFSNIVFELHPPCSEFFVRQSSAQASQRLPYKEQDLPLTHEQHSLVESLDWASMHGITAGDILIVTATK